MASFDKVALVCRALLALDRARAQGVLTASVGTHQTHVWLCNGHVLAVEPAPLSTMFATVGDIKLDFCAERVADLRGRSRTPTRDVVLDALRTLLAQHSAEELKGLAGEGAWRLTDVGRELVASSALLPAETAVVRMLAVPRRMRELRRGVWDAKDADRCVAMLRSLRAVASPESGSYRVLLKKRRELIRQIHPDRFRAGARAPVIRISDEVVSALVEAESLLRAG